MRVAADAPGGMLLLLHLLLRLLLLLLLLLHLLLLGHLRLEQLLLLRRKRVKMLLYLLAGDPSWQRHSAAVCQGGRVDAAPAIHHRMRLLLLELLWLLGLLLVPIHHGGVEAPCIRILRVVLLGLALIMVHMPLGLGLRAKIGQQDGVDGGCLLGLVLGVWMLGVALLRRKVVHDA